MKFKAIIFDIDGTAITHSFFGRPSKELINIVKKAQDQVLVSAATGRSIPAAREIFQQLNLKSPCVISGGTQIADPKTENILWQIQLAKNQVKQIMQVCLPYDYEILLSNELKGKPAKEKLINRDEGIVYIMAVKPKDVETLIEKLNKISDAVVHKTASWNIGNIDLHVTNIKATKKHAIEKLIEIFDVNKEEVIGVGDSFNDLPIFEAVGYKIAMGHAPKELKDEADFIAPPIKDDGLVSVIEKFILNI